MTIAVSLKVNDGVVLAADSATTLIGQSPDGSIGVVNVYNNANKIFNLVRDRPIGVVTWGAGSIGVASVSTLVKDLRTRLSGKLSEDNSWALDRESYTVEDVARKARRFIFDEHYRLAFKEWKDEDKPSLGFIVAGYSSYEDMAEEYQIDIVHGECSEPRLLRKKEDSGITWNGQTEAIYRLLVGFSSHLPLIFEENLGIPKEQVPQAIAIIQEALNFPLVIPPMPIQDAIDLAEFLVDLTIKHSRFAPGAPTVGGPIEIAAISKHEGFRWIQRKYYYSRDLNPEEAQR
jgi:hypothetical protein